MLKEQQTQEEKSSIISTETNTNTIANSTNQENSPPKKTNTNVLLDLAPKPSNTTKMIDVKAWDNLMRQNIE